MDKKKKPYQKPNLEELKMLDVGAALCCKSSLTMCSTNQRNSAGKGQRVSTPT